MKTTVFKLLRTTKNVLFAALVSGVILEIIILLFFGKFVGRFPDIWNIYNYVLAILALLSLLALISLLKEETNS
jgi:hypothetical protein